MPEAPATMFRMNCSWPGTSTTPTHARRQGAGGEPEIDRQTALLLLLEPVGLAAGQQLDQAVLPWSTWPAVPSIISTSGSTSGRSRPGGGWAPSRGPPYRSSPMKWASSAVPG